MGVTLDLAYQDYLRFFLSVSQAGSVEKWYRAMDVLDTNLKDVYGQKSSLTQYARGVNLQGKEEVAVWLLPIKSVTVPSQREVAYE